MSIIMQKEVHVGIFCYWSSLRMELRRHQGVLPIPEGTLLYPRAGKGVREKSTCLLKLAVILPCLVCIDWVALLTWQHLGIPVAEFWIFGWNSFSCAAEQSFTEETSFKFPRAEHCLFSPSSSYILNNSLRVISNGNNKISPLYLQLNRLKSKLRTNRTVFNKGSLIPRKGGGKGRAARQGSIWNSGSKRNTWLVLGRFTVTPAQKGQPQPCQPEASCEVVKKLQRYPSKHLCE